MFDLLPALLGRAVKRDREAGGREACGFRLEPGLFLVQITFQLIFF